MSSQNWRFLTPSPPPLSSFLLSKVYVVNRLWGYPPPPLPRRHILWTTLIRQYFTWSDPNWKILTLSKSERSGVWKCYSNKSSWMTLIKLYFSGILLTMKMNWTKKILTTEDHEKEEEKNLNLNSIMSLFLLFISYNL